MFTLHSSTPFGRRGTIDTPHGKLETPFFFPVATAGAMKGITLQDLETLGAQGLLANTYHLHLSPGEDLVEEAGGLHAFIGWDKPILTDSGGYQVFSLRGINKISDDGVRFRSHRNGEERFLGPVEAMEIQWKLGADIIMCFDECPPSTAPRADQVKAVDRTLQWAAACKKRQDELRKTKEIHPLLFGIVQGGTERDLRKKCAEELIAMNFDGYAIGGLAVGESEEDMFSVVKDTCLLLPEDKPRYLMGVGERSQMKTAASFGIDFFDCVAPMREGRHGNIWMSDGGKIRIRRNEYAKDMSPIDADSPSVLSQRHTKSYLHHLFRLHERYAETIACMQNIGVTLKAMKTLRENMEKL